MKLRTRWLRLMDTFPEHPKVIALSDRAFRHYLRALCYSSRHLTDGSLSVAVVRGALRIPPPTVIELVTAGLWHPTEAGWQIHDYLQYQLSRAEVEEQRQAVAASRKVNNGYHPPGPDPAITETPKPQRPRARKAHNTRRQTQTKSTEQKEMDPYLDASQTSNGSEEGRGIWARLIAGLEVSGESRRDFFVPCEVKTYDPAAHRLTIDARHPTRAAYLREHFTEALGRAARAIDPALRIRLARPAP